MQSENAEISKFVSEYLSHSEDEIFEALGVASRSRGEALSHSEDNSENAGRQFFLDKYEQIQNQLCGHKKIQELLDNNGEDIELAILVASVLLDPFGVITASLTAVLVTRRGLKSLCKNFK